MSTHELGINSSYFPYQSQSFLPVRDLSGLGTAFRSILQDRCDALVVFPDSAMYEVSDRIAQFALEAKLPSVSGWFPFAQKGLLMTYGPNVRELYRSLARYADRIPAWHKAGRSSDRGANQILSGDQFEDGQGARPRNPTGASHTRGRGDRVIGTNVCFWPKADIPSCTAHVRF